jgi:hypothetical protein
MNLCACAHGGKALVHSENGITVFDSRFPIRIHRRNGLEFEDHPWPVMERTWESSRHLNRPGGATHLLPAGQRDASAYVRWRTEEARRAA